MPYGEAGYDDRTPLMHEIRQNGVDLRRRKPPPFLTGERTSGARAGSVGRRVYRRSGARSLPRRLALAFIFERSGRSPKTHSGVQTEFARWAKNEPRIDPALRAFLGRTYNPKAIADDETGPGSKVTHDQASDAVVDAKRFIGAIIRLIG